MVLVEPPQGWQGPTDQIAPEPAAASDAGPSPPSPWWRSWMFAAMTATGLALSFGIYTYVTSRSRHAPASDAGASVKAVASQSAVAQRPDYREGPAHPAESPRQSEVASAEPVSDVDAGVPPHRTDPNFDAEGGPAAGVQPPDFFDSARERLVAAESDDLIGELSAATKAVSPPQSEDNPPGRTDDAPVETVPESLSERLDLDVTAQLSEKILGIQFPSIPLSVFVDSISRMSAIPISLNPEALIAAGITPDTPVTVNQSETTVGGVLTEVLATLDLGYVVDRGHVVVTWATAADDRLRRAGYDLSDLGGDDAESLAALGELIRGVVVPGSWRQAGGRGIVELDPPALVIAQTEPVHFQLSTLYENLRLARAPSPAGRRDPAPFQLSTRTERARVKLELPVTVNVVHPTPLPEILARLREQADVHLLIDWKAAAAVGWLPGGETTLSVERRPLGDALTALLRPLRLTYRVVDAGTLEVTNPRVLASRGELELYPVGDLLGPSGDGARLVRRIESALNDGGARGVLRLDRPSGCLVALLPQPRHMALANLLARYRAQK